MALKGKARIELFNKDGTKEVVEHGNMITNAVADLLYSPRGEMANVMKYSNNGDDFIRRIFGGILLFNETLNSDPEDYCLPSVNTVGYSATNAYSGLDTERGSYNEAESGLQSDGSYKLVWDFATSQANGQIQSIALCPNIMGYIGLSNSVVSSEKISAYTHNNQVAPFDTNNYMLPSSGNTEELSNYGFNIVAVIGNIAYAVHLYNVSRNNDYNSLYVKNNGGIIKLFRFDIGCSTVKLRSRIGMAKYIDCVDVQLPSDFVTNVTSIVDEYPINFSYDPKDKKLILYYCYLGTNITQNSTTKYVEIELANNMNTTLRTFTNNAPGYIYLGRYTNSSVYSYGPFCSLYITKDYVVSNVIVSSGVAKLFVTNKNDNTDIKEVRYVDGSEYKYEYDASYTHQCSIRRIYTMGNIFVFGYPGINTSTTYNKCCVLDMFAGLLKETNANQLTDRSNVLLDNMVTWGRTGNYLALSIAVNPFVLTTKNNLDAPVTKTASQTMKITYTLTESEV